MDPKRGNKMYSQHAAQLPGDAPLTQHDGPYNAGRQSVQPLEPDAPRSSLQHAIDLGAWVHEQLAHAGWVDSCASGERPSLRGLIRRLNAPMGVSTIWRALAIYRLSLKHPEIVHCRHLGVAHFSVILGVDEPYQLNLLRLAEHNRWSRRRLLSEVAALKRYLDS